MSARIGVRVAIEGVRKSFGALDALGPVTIDVEPGQTVTLLGPSGCGKTTLLRAIGGLERLTAGSIRVGDGTPEAARRGKRIGIVPQSPALLPWRRVAANASLLLDVNRRANGTPQPSASVDELLDEVGLGDFRDAYPHELSGGMQQRVGLVRAFALGAPVLLMDEPFAALDELTRADMRHLLVRLREPLGTTVVFVTHSITEAAYVSDRVVVMSARPGQVVVDAAIPLPHPRTPEMEDDDEFFHLTTRLRTSLSTGMGRP